MTTARERFLLERCRHLEAELLRARGFEVPAPPQVLVLNPPPHTYCVVTPALVAEMQALRNQGLTPYRIAFKLGCSHTTVRRYLEDTR